MRRLLTIALLAAALAAQPSHAPLTVATADPVVRFNKQTLKYHCPTCTAARQCTSNCIDLKKSAAVQRGGIACKICRGTCR